MAEKQKFYLDTVFCIDKTFNMFSQIDFIIDFVNAYYDMAKAEIQNSVTRLEQTRIKIITFGDYNKMEQAVTDYGFFVMPEQSGELFDALNEISSDCIPLKNGYASGLEALSYAIDSDWVDLSNQNGRQEIVVFSSNKPLSIEESRNLDNYPDDLPKNLLELNNKWNTNPKLVKNKKMLTLFCNLEKDKNSWHPLTRWDKVIAINTEDINEYTNEFLLETILIDII